MASTINQTLDPGLFRPPPDAKNCKPFKDDKFLVGMEHRNTLHFNPLHVPKAGGSWPAITRISSSFIACLYEHSNRVLLLLLREYV